LAIAAVTVVLVIGIFPLPGRLGYSVTRADAATGRFGDMLDPTAGP
jgi:hypothetical protein